MTSVKASQQGLVQIKKAIDRLGWKKSDDRPLQKASKVLEPHQYWHELGPYAYGCSRKTWERFLQGKSIRDRSFEAFCQVLGIDPQDVAQSVNGLKEDWGEAPDIEVFHGRQQELATLEQWIISERCRLITIVGFAGMGKTSLVRGGLGKTDLSLHLAHHIQGEFEYLIWRRLLNAPPPEILIPELIEFVSDNQETQLADTIDGLVTQLLKHLKQRRCLLILDNVESILQSRDIGGSYRSGYEGYGDLFNRIGKSEHQSCVLLTSRVKPRDIEDIEGIHKVRSLELNGLDILAGRAICEDIARAYNASFQGTEEDWSNLISFYSGNPLGLEVAARHILRRFDANLSEFLQQDLRVFGQIRDLLDWHFERLSDAEKTIMYWLALNREAVSIADLKQDILSSVEQKYLPETLDSLERQIPIEKTDTCFLMQSLKGVSPKTTLHRFTLQPVLIEYMSERAIAHVCQELESGKLQLFNSHALIKASANDYVKDRQIRLILQPIIDRLKETLGLESQDSLENRFYKLLSLFNRQIPGYVAGNLINLIRYASIDLEGWDFSQLTIWQADLQNLNLHRVNFANCKFANCSFTQDFGGIHAIAFSHNQDLLAIGDTTGGIRLFRLEDWQPYLYLKGHGKNAWVTELSFSPNDKLLASSSMDNTVKLWDLDTRKCLKTYTGKEQWIWSVAYSPDGQTVASSADDNTITLWNIYSNECQVLKGHAGWIWSVVFHPYKNLLASAAFDGTVRLWNTDTGKCFKILNAHQNAVLRVNFNPSGKILASCSLDCTAKLWDIDTGECLKTLKGHTKEVSSVAFSSDGQIIASGSFDRTAKLWDVKTGECLKTLKGHTMGIRMVDFAPDKKILATTDNYGMLKLWDVETRKCLKTWQGYANFIWTTAISPDGKLIASGSINKAVRLWNIETGRLISTWTGHDNWVWMVDFSPDGQTLASCSNDGTIKLWDVSTGKCQKTLRSPTEDKFWKVKFSPNGKLLASGGPTGNICFWDSSTGENLRCIEAHGNWMSAIAYSPDGRYLASCSADTTLKIWNVQTGECHLNLNDLSHKFISVAFHPHERVFVTGDEKLIKLWNLETGALLQTFAGHADAVIDLVFDSEGKIIFSSSGDSTIRIWEVDTGECIRVLSGHDSKVRAIALTPDKQTLASGSTDGTIRLWDLATGQTKKILRPKRPYEGMNIADVSGLTAAQKEALIALGATD